MKPTSLRRPASSIFLLLHAPTAISSQPSSPSILPLSSRLRRRRFSSTPNLNLDDPSEVLSHVRKICRNGGVFSSVGDAHRCVGAMMKTDSLPSPRDFSLLLGAVARMKHYSTAIRLIEQLRSLGVEDNHIWLNISLNCFCRLQRVDLGLSILGRILKLGFPIDVVASVKKQSQNREADKGREADLIKAEQDRSRGAKLTKTEQARSKLKTELAILDPS